MTDITIWGDRRGKSHGRSLSAALTITDSGAAPVIFGEPGDATLRGAVSLEFLGFVLDAVRRYLMPQPMVIGGAWVAAKGGLLSVGVRRLRARPAFARTSA